MKFEFDSIEEIQEFVKRLKGTRGGKGSTDDGDANAGPATGTTGAPAPLAPSAGQAGFGGTNFAPPAAGAGLGGAFGAPGVQTAGPSPEVAALCQRINTRVDFLMAPPPQGGGQPLETMLGWFRQQCGPETAQYNMDQLKQSALPRMSVPQLTQMAQLIGA